MNSIPTKAHRVLVIGSTTDYIECIERQYPCRAVFVTDPAERMRGKAEYPDPLLEILVVLTDPILVLAQIRRYLQRHDLRASGVACFDCESLHLASLIAAALGLPYPAPTAVLASRCKFLSKVRWQQAGVACPAVRQIHAPDEAVAFMQQHDDKIILKPLSGSGSELTFLCTTAQETITACAVMTSRFAAKAADRMYAPYDSGGILLDPRQVFLAEEYCAGVEYSCDFLIQEDRLEIIRVARKWLKPDPAPGTAMAYQIPEHPQLDHGRLQGLLRTAAQALGLESGLCMVDFLLSGDRMIVLELTPRPGGDCLPQLLRAVCGFDMLGLVLDVAESLPIAARKQQHQQRPLVALRLFAPLPGGTIARIDVTALLSDPRVRELELTAKPGRQVVHPPHDYHSRVLGYALFAPLSEQTVEHECLELLGKLNVTYQQKAS